MAGRKVILANGEYYHIYNRGIARQPVFFTKRDYERFLLALSYYRFQSPPVKLSRFLDFPQLIRDDILRKQLQEGRKLVEIVSFVFMPNHFHLLLRQKIDKGISIFLSMLINSYTRYINIKTDRVGDLFQGVFKAVHVETDEQLVHLSRYIHLNPLISFVVKEADFLSYPWSSLGDYLRMKSAIVDLSLILEHFKKPNSYRDFVLDRVNYLKRLKEINHLLLEK
ncbi:transposase [Candidatus Gottesmanbacteria bacterium]|nr:transposase [Candidatus Gottesmanbacteria bacterium]